MPARAADGDDAGRQPVSAWRERDPPSTLIDETGRV